MSLLQLRGRLFTGSFFPLIPASDSGLPKRSVSQQAMIYLPHCLLHELRLQTNSSHKAPQPTVTLTGQVHETHTITSEEISVKRVWILVLLRCLAVSTLYICHVVDSLRAKYDRTELCLNEDIRLSYAQLITKPLLIMWQVEGMDFPIRPNITLFILLRVIIFSAGLVVICRETSSENEGTG